MSRSKTAGKKGPQGKAAKDSRKVAKQASGLKAHQPVHVKPLQDHTRKKENTKNGVPPKPTVNIPGGQENKRRQEDEPLEGAASKKSKVSHNTSSASGPPPVSQFEAVTLQDTSTENSKEPSTTSLSSSSTALLSRLETHHTITTLSVISSTKIQTRVSRIISALSTFSFTESPPKSPLILLVAKAGCAQKLISIIEIVKREISSQGQKWYQYSSVEAKEVEVKAKQKPASKITTIAGRKIVHEEGGEDEESQDVDMDAAGEEDATSFEQMKTPLERAIEGRPKIRAIPVMTTYLSRIRIESLKLAFGEQTNEMTVKA